MNTSSSCRKLCAVKEAWTLKRPFVISRGSKSAADVVVASVTQDGFCGRGEAVPYGRYNESVDGVLACLRAYSGALTREAVNRLMDAGAARNALDCALWDLDAKLAGKTVADLAGVDGPHPVLTAFTISLGSPDEMAMQAREAKGLGLLKLKLGGTLDDIARMRAVRHGRPDARLIGDANEAWGRGDLVELMNCAHELGFEVIEQPLPVGEDSALVEVSSPVAICADESVHRACDLDGLVGRYDAVNIKLDKAGGLTEALVMVARARSLGLKVMVGSMVASSLAIAPALLLAGGAQWVDLDGPLLLKDDREFGLQIERGHISPAARELWG